MRSVTREEMQRLDRAAAENYSVPGLSLMENAGVAVCEVLCREFRRENIAVFVGKGNNGGDGLVVARHLGNRGYNVRIILLEDPLNLKSDPRINYALIEQMKVPVLFAGERTLAEEFETHCQWAGIIVDALFGIGIHSPVRGGFEKAIRAINQSGKPVVSIDIPSGLDADTGKVHGTAVKAYLTVALALPKQGFFRGEGPQHTGKIETVDIGIPRELTDPFLD